MKIALFCPRLPRESVEAWQSRYQACRNYLYQLNRGDALEIDTLENLRNSYRRHAFQQALVAHSGYYMQEFWEWACQERVPIVDVMLRPENSASAELAQTKSREIRSRHAHRAAKHRAPNFRLYL